MTFPLRLALAVVAAAGSYALGRAAPQTSREAAAVRSARSAQNTAIAARDLDRAASYWTDDVVIRSGLGRVVQGRGAYRAAMAADSATVFHREQTAWTSVATTAGRSRSSPERGPGAQRATDNRSSVGGTPPSGSSATGAGSSGPRCSSR